MGFGGGGSSGGGTTVNKTEPWSGQQPFLTRGFSEAERLYTAGPQKYFPGQTIAGISPETQNALTAISERATAGSPTISGATGLLSDTLSGKYLTNNPYLDETYNLAARQVAKNYRENVVPGIGSRFELAGRAGSPAEQRAIDVANENLGIGLSSLANQIYGGAYQQERGLQQQAAALAPALAEAGYLDASKLAQVGTTKQQQAQDLINEAVNRYNFEQQAGWNNLANYMNMIQGTYGGSSTQTQTAARGNPILGAAGGAIGLGALANMAGLGAASAFGPAGILVPAAAGGLLGGFL